MAGRPQKGRYREFYQCDADIIGSDSLLNELELIQVFDEVLTKLGLSDFTIKFNNRKILSGIAEVIGRAEMLTSITIAMDKLDKIGKEKVLYEMRQQGISQEELKKLEPVFDLNQADNETTLDRLKDYLKDSKSGIRGIDEITEVLDYLKAAPLSKAKLELDVTLARGLNYYTGAIFEVVAGGVKMGSICGGGRYDDLTGIFGLKGMSGVGISFGADRIYDVMEELSLFPPSVSNSTKMLLVNFGEKECKELLPLLVELRKAGIAAELYPDAAKLGKQFKYADQKKIKWVIIAGEEERKKGMVQLKNMTNGEQEEVNPDELKEKLKKHG